MLSSFAYDHDDCGNRTELTEATGDVTTYAYDSLYELTGQTKRNSGDVVQYSYSYTYDDIGNRLTLTDQGSAVTTSTYNAGGQLIGTDASGTLTTFTYDASGNLAAEVTSAGTRSYTWDYDDRLTQLENPDSSTVAFAYNAAGRLSGRTETSAEDSTTVEGRLYDGDKLVITKDGDGNTQVRYTTQGPAPYSDVISQRQNNQTYYYMLDGIHNVYQVVDSLLAIRNTYDYDWFRYMTQRNEEIRNDYHVSLWTTLYLDYSLYQAEQLCYQALYGRNIQMPFNNARFTSLLYPEFVARDAVLSPTPMRSAGIGASAGAGALMYSDECYVELIDCYRRLARDSGVSWLEAFWDIFMFSWHSYFPSLFIGAGLVGAKAGIGSLPPLLVVGLGWTIGTAVAAVPYQRACNLETEIWRQNCRDVYIFCLKRNQWLAGKRGLDWL